MGWFSFYNSTNSKAKNNPKTCEVLYKKITFHADKLAKCNKNTTCVDEEIAKICSYAHHTPLTDTNRFYIDRIRIILDGSALKTSSTELKQKCVDANQRLVDYLDGKSTTMTQPLLNKSNHGGKQRIHRSLSKHSKTYMKLTCKCTIRRTKKGNKARKTRKQ